MFQVWQRNTLGKRVSSSGKSETEVVTEGCAMTSKPKFQNNPNPKINSSAKPISPQKKQEETLKLPSHHPSVVSLESNVKLEDKPSCPYNSHTKHTKKCLVWCKMNSVKTQALWDTRAQVSIMSGSPKTGLMQKFIPSKT